jgi:NADH:ubiquinone oxidoreductase subunit 2 (subunit N)
VLVVMYMDSSSKNDDRDERRVRSPWLNAALWACAGLTLLVGLWPEPVLGWARGALGSMWG